MINLRIRSLVIGLAGFVCAAFAGSVAVQQFSASQMAINSPHYHQIVAAKDLVADVLPPPAYLVEAYLEATLAIEDPSTVEKHATRLVQLEQDYNARHAHWSDRENWKSDDGVDEKLYELISKTSNVEAQSFWAIVNRQLLPAIRSGDVLAVEAAQHETTAAFERHRAIVDEMVKLAQSDQAILEQIARDQIGFYAIVTYIAVGAALLLSLLGFAFVIRRAITPIAAVTGVMRDLAGGNLSVKAEGADRTDEVGDMLRALEVFRTSLQDAERMRLQQAEERAKAEVDRRESLRGMAATVESEAGSAVTHVSNQAGTMSRLAGEMAKSVTNVTAQCQSAAAAAHQAMASATSVTAATQQFSASIQEVSQQLGRARTVTSHDRPPRGGPGSMLVEHDLLC